MNVAVPESHGLNFSMFRVSIELKVFEQIGNHKCLGVGDLSVLLIRFVQLQAHRVRKLHST